MLSACGSTGVMHDGNKAGSFDGHSVSNADVQTAVKQISAVSPQGGFDGQSATAFILLLPKLEAIGHKYGIVVSPTDVRKMFPKSTDLAEPTIKAARGSLLFTRLQQQPQAKQKVIKLLRDADVNLNPRYGQWVQGKGPKKDLSPWIKQQSNSTAAAAG